MAIPQILQQLGMRAVQQNPNINQLQRLMKAARNAKDGEALMKETIESNPKYREILQQMQSQGGTLKEAFMKQAQAMGMSEADVMNMLK